MQMRPIHLVAVTAATIAVFAALAVAVIFLTTAEKTGGTPTAASTTTEVAVTTTDKVLTTTPKVTTTTRPTTTTTVTTTTAQTTTVSPLERPVTVALPSTVRDDTIVVQDGEAFSVACNPATTWSLTLPLDGEVAGASGGPMKVKKYAAYIEVTWDSRGADTLVVNKSQWGFVRESGDVMPSASRLYRASGTGWGEIHSITACVRR